MRKTAVRICRAAVFMCTIDYTEPHLYKKITSEPKPEGDLYIENGIISYPLRCCKALHI